VVSGVFSIPLELTRSGVLETGRTTGSRWMLREFISGDENALVQVATQSVLDGQPDYKPILIYGPPGTGKSLLAHGLAGRWRKANPRTRVMFTTGSDFARHYADAVDTNAVSDFRQRLRSVALLVIDGIHQLANKPAAQLELIGTLDKIAERKAQLLATATHLPAEINDLLPGLASRLSAGLTVPLHVPGAAARQEIVRRLAAAREVDLPDGVVQLLAEGCPGTPHFLNTVPQLDQALQQLTVTAQLASSIIDENLVRQFLLDESPAQRTTLRSIAQHVARHFRIKSTDLRGATRRQHIVRARGIAMHLARALTGKSLQQVGKYFGDRDHSTVLHACRKTEALLKADSSMRETVQALAEQICNS
jgi:chromosomal replication initiator protein